MPTLVLASASPRRQDLLTGLGIPFIVRPSRIAEIHPPGPPASAVAAVALDKARAVASEWTGGPAIVLGADTEVVLDGRYLGKPRDAADANRMLRALCGRTHDVVTGVALVETPSGREETTAVTTRVTMIRAGDDEIAAYVATRGRADTWLPAWTAASPTSSVCRSRPRAGCWSGGGSSKAAVAPLRPPAPVAR